MLVNGLARVAILGTLAEFHNEAIPFELASLLELVTKINPDLLCLDITPRQWRDREFDTLPLEYREALLPLAHQTDIVVVPIGSKSLWPNEVISRPQRQLIAWLRGWIESIQRTAPGPDAVSQGWRHRLTNYLYDAIRLLSAGAKKREQAAYVDALVQRVVEVSQQDPDNRLLVVVNVQLCHLVRRRLRTHREVEIKHYLNL